MFVFDQMSLALREIEWEGDERERHLNGLLKAIQEQTKDVSLADLEVSDLEEARKTIILTEKAIRDDEYKQIEEKKNQHLRKIKESAVIVKEEEFDGPSSQESGRSYLFETKTPHGASMMVKVITPSGERNERILSYTEFRNLLAHEGSGFVPALGFSVSFDKEEPNKLCLYLPKAPKTLETLLPEIKSLVDIIDISFQLVSMVEGLRYDAKVLKKITIVAHNDIKDKNIVAFRLPSPFGWRIMFIDAETANIANSSALPDDNDPDIKGVGGNPTFMMREYQKEVLRSDQERSHLKDMEDVSFLLGKLWGPLKDLPWYDPPSSSSSSSSSSAPPPPSAAASSQSNVVNPKKILEGFVPIDRKDRFLNIFDKSLDFHVLCFWLLAGYVHEENKDVLFQDLREMILSQRLLKRDLCPLPERNGDNFNWLFLTQQGKRLVMNCAISPDPPASEPERCLLYVSSEHAFVRQAHALTLLCQILEHMTLFFPFAASITQSDGNDRPPNPPSPLPLAPSTPSSERPSSPSPSGQDSPNSAEYKSG